MMLSISEKLHQLQLKISQAEDFGGREEYPPKFYFMEREGLFHVAFHGNPFEEPYADFLHTVSNAEVANQLRTLEIRGPDEGANGTREWDLTLLLDSEAEFPNLHTLFIEPTAPEHHNQSVVGIYMEEGGQLGRMLAKTPSLKFLTAPSAPDAGFFEVGTRPLVSLTVESGYSHQNFIANLSQSNCFPQLRTLDFGDFSQTYMNGYSENCTTLRDYEALFRSQAFADIRRFTLRNSVLTAEHLAELRHIQSEVQFFVIQTRGDYVR